MSGQATTAPRRPIGPTDPCWSYENEEYIGDLVGWYRAAPITYATPRVGDYKIFNPIFNAEIAKRMYDSRGWQPWSVAQKLGY